MLKKLTLKKFLDLAKTKNKIAIYQEVNGDKITPISAYHALSKNHSDISLLESCDKLDRYSYLFLDPCNEFIADKNDKTNPFTKLEEYLKECDCYREDPLCRYAGAALGFVSYDAIRFIENISDTNKEEIKLPDIFFRSYQTCMAFDHINTKTIVTTVVDVDENPELNYQDGFKIIKKIIKKISQINLDTLNTNQQPKTNNKTSVDISDEQYIEMVKKAKQYIIDGDAFQIVLSRTFKKKFNTQPFDIYRALRITNPSPYMFYLKYKDITIIGASPEKLVSVKEGLVETNPIAGTRPRGSNKQKNIKLENELLQDQKELAEHMMLVDLGRNDLGSICIPNSVKVKKLKEIQKLSKVMHITSLVEGKLDPRKTIIDAIKAVFPAGTLSGAPKIRAMNIIDELETKKRGLYGGAICIIDGTKNLDVSIAIRMAILKENIAYIRAGAGIVFDSDPKKEAEETKHKVKAVISAINLAEGGLK